MVHHLFFDLDGCLYWEGLKRDGVLHNWKCQQDINSRKALCHFGMSKEEAAIAVSTYRGSKLLRLLIEKNLIEDILENRDVFWNIYNYGTTEGVTNPNKDMEFNNFMEPNHDVVEFIKSLSSTKYKKYIFTNGNENMAKERMINIGLDPENDFEYIFGAEFLHPHYKPDGEGYRKVFSYLNLIDKENGSKLTEPASFFEDTAANLRIPRDVYNMYTIGVISNPQPPNGWSLNRPPTLSEYPDCVALVKDKIEMLHDVSDIVVPCISKEYLGNKFTFE